jgi:hypothetical protein
MVHEYFCCPTDSAYEKVIGLAAATGEKVRNVISHMRASLNRIITNWEQSGQGYSGHLPVNGAHGNLQNRSVAALDSRASFLVFARVMVNSRLAPDFATHLATS